jgi:hypothetical protein
MFWAENYLEKTNQGKMTCSCEKASDKMPSTLGPSINWSVE